MICKNCGAQIQDNFAFCGNCGAMVERNKPLNFGENMTAPNINPYPQSGGNESQPVMTPNLAPELNYITDNTELSVPKKELNWLYIMIPVAALIVVVGIIFGIVQAAFSNLEKTIDRFMTAFEDGNGESMNLETSEAYKNACVYYLEILNVTYGNKLEKELGDDFDKAVDDIFIENYERQSDDFFYSFKSYLGRSYKLSHEITATETATKDELKKFNEILSRVSSTKGYSPKALMLADIKVMGKSGSNTYDKGCTMFLCKEGLKWRVLGLFELGYEFDDLYDIINWDDFDF